MPAHQLATTVTRAGVPADALTAAVHSVLAGTPLAETAAQHGLTSADLDDAVETYCQAGATALYDRTADAGWWQAHLEFADWAHAENIAATCLEPHLRSWCANGLLDAWWFIRKAPCWRLRLRTHLANKTDTPTTTVAALFDQLVDAGHLLRWCPTHYEPEALAFGGPVGIAIAHDLFSADSANLLEYLRADEHPLGRRELSLLLCTGLFRAAGLEWYEAGDVWHRVTCLRSDPNHTSTDHGHHTTLSRQLRTLLTYDTRPAGPIFGPDGAIAALRPWAKAFHNAGHALAAAANQASLHRGLRATLAHHVIFHWNRLGLDAATQHALAHAATTAILQPSEEDRRATSR
ncbi:thiopeptide-type bacteriocin biosynthesis protein [Saccharopolyspora hattusasensis]|uniref:thiopeptide-type bacteriocin biosynthesis protein n=1 Tax=Saccharopolyspora hattusasensis TaxID=1128679 RepID=UPI003D996127